MNERIRELALQAEFYSFTDGELQSPFREEEDISDLLEKFAELIVAECIQLCQECIDDGCVEAQEPMGKIKQHFGVEECWCESCKPNTMTDMRMILCQICGNKRCPHATNHIYECTNSNEPGQKGSSWENYKVGVEE